MERTPLRPRRSTQPRTRAMAVSDGGPPLPLRDAQFISEYLIDYNGTAAAKRIGVRAEQAPSWASAKLREPAVLMEIQRRQVLSREQLQLDREDLMQIWYDLAHADIRELIPVRVRCCRHCWGIEHQYQFTQNELQNLYRQHRERNKNTPGGPPAMDTKGGDGFDQRLRPFSIQEGQDHDCPECNGMGQMVPEPLDIERISRGAQLLIGGIKVDRFGGAEIKFNDRLKAVEKLEQYLGFIKPRKGLWVFDFDQMDDDQLDALLVEARTRGLLREDELPQRRPMIDVSPRPEEGEEPTTSSDEDERVS